MSVTKGRYLAGTKKPEFGDPSAAPTFLSHVETVVSSGGLTTLYLNELAVMPMNIPEGVTTVPVRCVAKVVLSTDRLPILIELLVLHQRQHVGVPTDAANSEST